MLIKNDWTAAIVCNAIAHAPEVAAADSDTDSTTQSSNTRKKSKHCLQIILIHYDVLRNVFSHDLQRVSISFD